MPTNTNTNASAPKLNQRIAPTVARAIVRLWPRETRQWGQAFAAELPDVESAGATLPWLIGGLTVMLREWCKHAWHSLIRPIGANPNATEPAGAFTQRYSRTPCTPLWVMLLLAGSSTAILLHPEVRQVLGMLRAAYDHSEWRRDNWSSVKKLREVSKSNRDPQLLALLSILSNNDEERLRLSDEAIKKDPSLTWLDYEQSFKATNVLDKQNDFPSERVERLQKRDPQNSVPHILAAEIIAKPAQVDEFEAITRGRHMWDLDKRLATNSDWISEMHAAFSAPEYDDYTAQLIELVRTVSARFSVRDPKIAEYALSTKRQPRFEVVEAYLKYVTDRGSSFEKVGNTQQALAAYSEILRFAQRMHLNAEAPGEQYFADEIGRTACEKLAPLYASTGRADEASMVSLQSAQWKAEQNPRFFRDVPLRYRGSQFNSIAWSGLLINVTGLSLLVIFPLTLVSVLYVFSRRKASLEQRGFTDFLASLCADAGPWLLLASSVLLYFTYHPFARLAAEFLKGGSADPDIQSFLTAMLVPYAIPHNFDFLHDPYSQWSALTAALCLLLVLFLWRMILRRAKSAV
jgi:hypothetical protein